MKLIAVALIVANPVPETLISGKSRLPKVASPVAPATEESVPPLLKVSVGVVWT